MCVSRGEQEKGKVFAENLADKLAFECLSQEDIVELAIREGIAVGKLETAAVKRRPLNERQVLEKEHFLAFMTRVLCERALESNLVFHGRAPHLAVPGVMHVLRIRTEIDTDTHIAEVMRRLSLDRAKAKHYVESINQDITRWIRTMYHVDGDPWTGHDLVINLDRVDVGGATTALCSFVQLPEFQVFPASINALENLLLAARVRIALARDERTWTASFSVRAAAGHVTVSFFPRDATVGVKAPDVIGSIAGMSDLTCAMAATNILWVQERFQATGATFEAVVKTATLWHSALELVKLSPATSSSAVTDGTGAGVAKTDPPPLFTARQVDGGIEEDVEPAPGRNAGDADLGEVIGELNARGIAGSASRFPVHAEKIGAVIDRSIPYSLVVVGDVYLDHGHATRLRKTRELVGRLGDVIKAPVVNAEDLGQMVHTGWSDYAKMIALAAIAVGVVFLVFDHQYEVLSFFSPASTGAKAVAAAVLLAVVPIFAMMYGTLAGAVLRLFHVE